MSKTYDALVRSWREQAGQKPVSLQPEPPSEPHKEPKQEAAPFVTLRQIERQKLSPKRTVYPERIVSQVLVGDFLATPDSVLEEQFRKLKSTITTHNLASSLRSMLVTSCMPGEGKTTVALNLAATIATGLDDSAILVDGDLRRLRLTTMLGLGDAGGLSDILEERVSIDDAMMKTEIDGLLILPGGVSPGNPGNLIASNRMRSLLRQLREQYGDSYIIIDSTPIASTSEVHVLSQMVDGVIVVIMADKTRRDLVRREIKTISREKILGAVLNCAEFETSDYYHKYYGQGSYRQYSKEKV